MQLSAGRSALAFGGEVREREVRLLRVGRAAGGRLSGYGGNFPPTSRIARRRCACSARSTSRSSRTSRRTSPPATTTTRASAARRRPRAACAGSRCCRRLLRASYGEGFRAPSLQDLFLPLQTSVTPVGLSDPDRCPVTNNGNDCQTQFNVQFWRRQKNLKPEKSKNFDARHGARAGEQLHASASTTSASTSTNTIVNGVNPAQSSSATPAQYGNPHHPAPQTPADIAAGIPGPITSINQININLGTTKISGLDFDVKWRIPTAEMGRFTVSGTATYFIKLRHSEHRRSFHRQRRPHQRGDGRRHPAVQELPRGRLDAAGRSG